MWRVYVHKRVMTDIFDVSAHAQKKDDVCKHVVISKQQTILLH